MRLARSTGTEVSVASKSLSLAAGGMPGKQNQPSKKAESAVQTAAKGAARRPDALSPFDGHRGFSSVEITQLGRRRNARKAESAVQKSRISRPNRCQRRGASARCA